MGLRSNKNLYGRLYYGRYISLNNKLEGLDTHRSTATTKAEGGAMSGAETALKPNRSREGDGVARQVSALLRGQTEAAASNSKTQLAAQVLGLARAVRRGGEQLYEDELLRLARLSDVLADELESAGLYLETQSSHDLLDDMRRLLQRHGALVIGSAAVAGVLTFYLAPKLRQRRYRYSGERQDDF